MRKAEYSRKTRETDIKIKLNIDGNGNYSIKTPSGFFTHMLESFAKHSRFDIELVAEGDVEVDLHHTVEDTGIVLGTALLKALSDARGIKRFSHAIVPMDEALVMCAVDVSGRGYLHYNASFPVDAVGNFPVELVEEFFKAFCRNAVITLHINVLYGSNAHHMVEAIFKAVAMCIRDAVSVVGTDIPSTKGVI